MYSFDPSQVIAHRTFTGPGLLRVHLSFCLPQPMPDMPSDWYCAYRVQNLEDIAVDRYSLGIDSVQALQLALIAAGEYLNQHATPLSFLNMPNLGLPGVASNLNSVLGTTSHQL